MRSELIRLSNLSMAYGNHTVLKDISLTIPSGEIIGLIGANGCGKTTMMKIIAGLIQTYSGEVQVLGETDTWNTKHRVCFYPSNPFYFPSASIEQALKMHVSLFPNYNIELARSVYKQFSFDLSEKLGTLSKGRCALAQFILHLARDAQLFLLDEPFGGIDIKTRELMKDVLLSCIMPDRTYLISTHEISDMETLFDRILLVKNGSVIINDTTDELRATHSCSITDIVKEAL